MKNLLCILTISLSLFSSTPCYSEISPELEFSIITVNMNQVPDILRLPKANFGSEVTVPTGHLRWEEDFYILIEPRGTAVTDLKVEQKQINCLSHPKVHIEALKDWPKRESPWKEMTFVGTNRYKGAEFSQVDLSSPSLENLEAFINSQGLKNKEGNLAIAKEITAAPERHSYHCESLIKITHTSGNQHKEVVTYRIKIE